MADDQITAAARDALTKVPQFLLRGVDPSKLKVVVTPNSKQGYHSDAIASVDVGDPNTIQIHDAKAFMQPGAAVQTIAHELTHVQQNRVNPSVKFAAINSADPYGYDANNIQGDSTKYSPEQLGAMVQQYTRIQNAPNLNPQQKAQLSAPYGPVLKHFSSLPQTVITPSDPSSPGINTQPLPPAALPGNLPLDANQVDPETVPSQGSGSQTISDDDIAMNHGQVISDDDIAEPASESLGSRAMGFVAGQGLPIAGALVGGALGSVEPGAGTVAGAALGGMAGNELNTALRGSTGQSADTGAKRVAGDLEAGAGGAYFGKLEKGTHALTTAIADSALPSRSVNALHTDIESVARRVASDAGVDVKPTDNVRKIISNTADAVRQKAQEKIDAIDDVYDGLKFNLRGAAGKFTSGSSADLGLPEKFSGYDEQLQKLSEKLHSMPGAENIEKRGALQKQIQALTLAKSQAANALDRQGLGGAREEATRLLQQADELDNLKAAHNRANFGPPGREAKTNPIKFQKEIAPLHESGQLHIAVGPENAEDLMDAADRSARTFKRATAATTAVKTVGKLAARGIAEGVGAGTAYRTLESLTK